MFCDVDSGILAEWLRRLIRNQLGTLPREFESLRCRFIFCFCNTNNVSTKHRRPPWSLSSRGAMDSAPDFESGGCGFESRRECFFLFFFISGFLVETALESSQCRYFASIAQLAEHVLRKHKVTSSILVEGSPVVSD